jgi:hypothetical protein
MKTDIWKNSKLRYSFCIPVDVQEDGRHSSGLNGTRNARNRPEMPDGFV